MNYTLMGILMIAGPVVYAIAGVLISRKILHGKVVEGHNDVCVPIFLNAGVLFAVLLGFMVVAVWESYDAANATVASEASALVPLYRATYNLPPEAGDRMREAAREYVESVIKDEWPVQAATGGASPITRRDVGNMFRLFGPNGFSTEVKKEFPLSTNVVMNSVTEVSNLKAKRGIEANESVPSVMWAAILGGAFVIISLSFTIFMEKSVPHLIAATTMAALIGLLLYSCFILSHPFKGPIAISPESFEKTLSNFDSIDQGN